MLFIPEEYENNMSGQRMWFIQKIIIIKIGATIVKVVKGNLVVS